VSIEVKKNTDVSDSLLKYTKHRLRRPTYSHLSVISLSIDTSVGRQKMSNILNTDSLLSIRQKRLLAVFLLTNYNLFNLYFNHFLIKTTKKSFADLYLLKLFKLSNGGKVTKV